MKHPNFKKTLLAGLIGLSLYSAGAVAEEKLLRLPSGEEVTAPISQVQLPDAVREAQPVKPVSVQVDEKAPPAAGEAARKILSQAPDQVAVVAPETAPAKAGYATNLATEGAKPAYSIMLKMPDPASGKVEVAVMDSAGQPIGKPQALSYDENALDAFNQELRSVMLDTMKLKLPQEPSSQDALPPPQLRMWWETKDGKPIQVGSSVRFHIKSNRDGYLSLYDFSPDKTVNRIFPDKENKVNFIEHDRQYQIPKSGWLIMEGSAGPGTLKGVLTLMPSSIDPSLNINYKGGVLQVIPTAYPTLFADENLERFFGLPEGRYAEAYLPYEVKAQ